MVGIGFLFSVSSSDPNEAHSATGFGVHGISWILGAAILAAVVVAAVHVSEGREFIALAEGRR